MSSLETRKNRAVDIAYLVTAICERLDNDDLERDSYEYQSLQNSQKKLQAECRELVNEGVN